MTKSAESTYDAAAIEVLEGLEAVRKRPGMYIGGTGGDGLEHLLWEIIDNGIDEAAAGFADLIEVTLHADGSCEVADNGRGIPIGLKDGERTALEVVFTELHAGGKFGQGAYSSSGGLHGVGASVVNAMSSRLVVEVDRDKATHRLEFVERVAGNRTGKSPKPGVFVESGRFRAGHRLLKFGRLSAKQTGTRVRFWPDMDIFDAAACIDYGSVRDRAELMSFLVPNVTIRLTDLRGDEPSRSVMCSTGGLADLVEARLAGRDTVCSPIVVAGEGEFVEKVPVDGVLTEVARSCRVDAVLRWYTGYDSYVSAFANTIPTPEGGTHVTGFERALNAAVNKALDEADLRKLRRFKNGKNSKNSKNGGERATRDDTHEGLIAAVRVRFPEPQFRGQTKRELGTPQVQRIVYDIVRDGLAAWFDGSDKTSKKSHTRAVLDKVADAMITRVETKQAAESKRKAKSLSGSGMPDKLADCRKHPEGELLIVEGDSAAGPAKRARDSQWQAVLPLRGKVVNAAKSSLRAVLDNAEAQALFTAVGAGSGKQFHLDEARYQRLVLLADADVDGSHIRCLVLTLVYHHMRPLLEAGRVYAAQPPTHAVTVGDSKSFVYSDAELTREVTKLASRNRKHTVTRFKGLGEMDDVELFETTLNPETRVLRRILLEEAEQSAAETAFGIMMGAPVEPRREFIIANSADYGHTLDI